MSSEVRVSSAPGGKTIAFHPKKVREAGVRMDGDNVILMWTGGHLVLKLSDVSTSWQKVNDGTGQMLPFQLKRSGFASFRGIPAVDVKFT